MTPKLFDSHAHLTFETINGVEAIQRAVAAGVMAIMDIAVNHESLEKSFQLDSHNTPLTLYHAAATTPHDVTGPDDPFFDIVERAVRDHRLAAIGETGLDFFHATQTKEFQETVFLRYAQLAVDTQKPLIIHCREAFPVLIPLLKSFGPALRGVIHCFTGTKEEAATLLDMGWPLSISGIVTFSKSEALREVVRFVPLDALLIETDAPYLAPGPKRGQINEPSFIVHTAETIALIKGTTLERVCEKTFSNALKLFATKI
jgi:TatD DNase family protein